MLNDFTATVFLNKNLLHAPHIGAGLREETQKLLRDMMARAASRPEPPPPVCSVCGVAHNWAPRLLSRPWFDTMELRY